MAAVRAGLDPDRFTDAWRAGETLPLEAAVADALAAADIAPLAAPVIVVLNTTSIGLVPSAILPVAGPGRSPASSGAPHAASAVALVTDELLRP